MKEGVKWMPLMEDALPFQKAKLALSILSDFFTCQTHKPFLRAADALPTPVDQRCWGQLSSTADKQREAAGAHGRDLSYLQAKASCSSAAFPRAALHNRTVWHPSASKDVDVFT